MYGDIGLRYELLRLIGLKVPDVNNARLVSEYKFLLNIIISYERQQSEAVHLLVGMEVNTIHWTVGLVNFLARQISHLQVPDPGRAVLSACKHPPSILL